MIVLLFGSKVDFQNADLKTVDQYDTLVNIK